MDTRVVVVVGAMWEGQEKKKKKDEKTHTNKNREKKNKNVIKFTCEGMVGGRRGEGGIARYY